MNRKKNNDNQLFENIVNLCVIVYSLQTTNSTLVVLMLNSFVVSRYYFILI